MIIRNFWDLINEPIRL